MRDFQAIGASLDAASRNVNEALICSEIVPIEGFSSKLIFSNPEVIAAGKSATATTHPGMKPLMDRMAKILREQTIDYRAIMEQAIVELSAEITIDADAFTRALNGARAATGLPPLVSAEGEVADRVEEALMAYRERWAAENEHMVAERVKSAIEAHEASRVGGTGGYDGDPPPPRGVVKRRNA